MASELRSALRSHGGAPGIVRCTSSPHVACVFFAHYRGASIGFQVHGIAGYLNSSSVALGDIQDSNLSWPPARPLPPIGTLGAIPGDVPVDLRCVKRLGTGCAAYAGRFAQHGSAHELARRWLGMLQRSGWLTQPYRCGELAVGSRCTIVATRSVAPNGGRFVSIAGNITDSASKLTGVLQLFALN